MPKIFETMTKIKQDRRNYRVHNDENKRVIRKSLEELGAGRSIVIDNEGEIIAGNGVYEQAQKLGIKTKIVETDGSELVVVKRTDLATGDDKRKKLALADNAASDTSEWADELLREDWTPEVLADFGVTLPEADIQTETKEAQEDDFDEEKDKVETVCKKGDIWQLGNHRLMCGDSTNAEDFAALMGEERADISFTSPPYNLLESFHLHKGQKDGYLGGENAYNDYADNRTPEDYAKFLTEVLNNCLAYSDDTFLNIGYTKGALSGTALFLGQNAKKFGGAITWRKSGCYMPFFPDQFGVMGNITEPVYIFNEEGTRKLHHPQWKQGEVSYNIVETKSASGNEFSKEHSATFPVEFPFEFIKRFCKDSVLDCFGGTGTTMIAAERLGRKCYMMELDPHYCDVIIARWEKFTGQKAIKL